MSTNLQINLVVTIPGWLASTFHYNNLKHDTEVTLQVDVPYTPRNLWGTIFNSSTKCVLSETEKTVFQYDIDDDRFYSVEETELSLPEPLKSALELEALTHVEEGHFELCEEGVGGTYFINNDLGKKIGVFKPLDEEPGAIANPKKLLDKPLLPPGGGGIREVAAYVLDEGFSGVPETRMLTVDRFHEEKASTGSLQQFIPNDGSSSDMSSSRFSVDGVHRIGILDCRIFNLDRNGENMLVKKQDDGEYSLIPIDHTYSLPPVTSLDGAYFDWMYWKQAKSPFSQETIDYVKSINIEEDAQKLHDLGISEECIDTMRVSTLLLKKAVSDGKNLFEIAKMFCRSFPNMKEPTILERLVSEAFANEGSDFITSFSDILNSTDMLHRMN